ncbi:O-antigen ligase family protein [Curtobacterium sp. 458]|uniref:O-antigen ligase family protein n=1 Tax=Curtobacterium sp. 458 TaxID=3050069 RepID=UPI0025B42D5E|nr:O-antigen ligase family protein [Curtobacterium sp. 458]WJY00590.1 O-antigen ligase family protein [Curtobacterium sp. 458]
MLFLVQIALSLVVALATVRRPQWGIAAVVLSAALLPFEVVRSLLGTSWHPATTIGIALLVVTFVRDPLQVGRVLCRHAVVTAVLLVFIAIAIATSWFTGRAGDLGTIVLQLIAPTMVFLVVRARSTDQPGLPSAVARMIVLVAVGETLLILGIWSGLVPQPWLSTLEGLRWWATDSARMLGTFDHPLVAALWISAAVPMAAALGTVWARTAVPVLLVVGVALTGSRSALFAAVLAVVVLILRSRIAAVVKVAALGAATIGLTTFLGSAAGAIVNDRLEDDGGSSSARFKTIGLAVEQWRETAVIGRGFGASEQVTRNALIGNTFENPFLMFSVDFGLVAAVLFFAAIVGLVFARRAGAVRTPGTRLAAALTLLTLMGFNSLSTNTPIGLLLFLLLAIVPGSGAGDTGGGRGEFPTADLPDRADPRCTVRAGL